MSLYTTAASTEDRARSRGPIDRVAGNATSPAKLQAPTQASAVSWGAVAAGAAAAASLSLILLILGVGLGLSSVSPWARDGLSAAALGAPTILWLTITQLLASGMGGYLAGRLRTRWTDVQADELYFRDTAHGFLAWALATLVTAALLTSAITSIVGGGVQAGASMLGSVASTATAAVGSAAAPARTSQATDGGAMGYWVDSLFRRDAALTSTTPAASERTAGAEAAEVGRIFMNLSRAGPLPPEDLRYVAQVVAQRTGLSQQAAEQRVSDGYAKAQTQLREAEVAARQAADKARKATATGALWLFVSLLIGAFVASLAATLGGRNRDS